MEQHLANLKERIADLNKNVDGCQNELESLTQVRTMLCSHPAPVASFAAGGRGLVGRRRPEFSACMPAMLLACQVHCAHAHFCITQDNSSDTEIVHQGVFPADTPRSDISAELGC